MGVVRGSATAENSSTELRRPGRRINPWAAWFSLLGILPVGLGVWGSFAYSSSLAATIVAAVLFFFGIALFIGAHRAEQLQRRSNTALLQSGTKSLTLRGSVSAYALTLLGLLCLMPEVILWAYDFPTHTGHSQNQALMVVLWGVFVVLILVFLMVLAKGITRRTVALDPTGMLISSHWSATLPWDQVRAVTSRLDQLEIALFHPATLRLKQPPFTQSVTLARDRTLVLVPAIILPVPMQDLEEAMRRRLDDAADAREARIKDLAAVALQQLEEFQFHIDEDGQGIQAPDAEVFGY
jgi:hypothetical protein